MDAVNDTRPRRALGLIIGLVILYEVVWLGWYGLGAFEEWSGLGLAGLFILFGFVVLPVLRVVLSIQAWLLGRSAPIAPTLLGDARHSTHQERLKGGLIGSQFGEGIRLGFEYGPKSGVGQVMRYTGPGNLILVAPPRAGKFRDELAQAVLEFGASGPGASLIVIDPKGQICATTKRQREKLGRVFVLSPFYEELENHGIHLGARARFNPMAALNPKAKAFTANCNNLAEAIVPPDPNEKNKYFSDNARNLVCGFMMYLVESPAFSTEQKTLGYMRNQLATRPFDFAREAFDKGSDDVKELIGDFADERARANSPLFSVLSTARTSTSFISHPTIRESLSGSDFDFAELKSTPTTVYVVVPTEYLGDAGGTWFRLIVGSAINRLGGPKRLRVLIVIDEMSALGKLEVLQRAMAYSAGQGYQVWPIMQSLEQFQIDYPAGWKTFLGTAAIRQFYGAGEMTTAEYVSKECGPQTIVLPGSSTTTSDGGKTSTGHSTHFHQQPLYLPDQVMRLSGNQFLMFAPSIGYVTRGFRAPYFDERYCPEFKGLYDPDPYEQDHSGGASGEEIGTNKGENS